ncbi:toll/interleukin-1 receptor-like protein [Olea europaea var. sylvestris]|uniref:toll/interleukin-1 receptor-like protein n=1 Tax=Olea europaea var. sylvestris TaxID=158386 RepID=UPI000C1D08A1|nr:toll/interleukin-1 receptor-like protein [Olea europaea var. sylvestris]
MEESNDVSESTPAAALRLKWDVFLSFHGEDARNNFVDLLYNSLLSNEIRVFRDNDGTNRVVEIAPSFFEAIEDSAVAVAVISPSYASSPWCLEELARICELRKLVLPVFFQVDPSDVRRLEGPFKEDIESLEARCGVDKVKRWRNAMERVGGISGWVYNSRLIYILSLSLSHPYEKNTKLHDSWESSTCILVLYTQNVQIVLTFIF